MRVSVSSAVKIILSSEAFSEPNLFPRRSKTVLWHGLILQDYCGLFRNLTK
jgi:hypothetical protein